MSRTSTQIAEGAALLELSLKRCGKCSRILHLESFFKGAGLGGFRPACKECMAVASNAWRQANIDRVRELERSPKRRAAGKARTKRYCERHRERLNAAQAERRRANPEHEAQIKRRTYLKNQEKNKAYSAAWRAANPEKVKAWSQSVPRDVLRQRAREWKARNRDWVRAYSRKVLATPEGKLRNRTRARVRESLKNNWSGGKTFKALGYTVAEMRAHLERQFTRGMSWDNMSEWHIDHIIPLSSFTITDASDPEFKRAWALTNLRPLWAADNMVKSDRILTLL